jgi:hypothetical protein
MEEIALKDTMEDIGCFVDVELVDLPKERRQNIVDRPGIGAPGHLFKSARVATYYNVLHYITTSSHNG